MKELFPGNLVFHKKYGRGIVAYISLGTDTIHFENYSTPMKVPRKEVFTKGDKVYNTSWNGGRKWDTERYTFYDAITHSPKCKSKFTLKRSDGKIVYVISIKHVDEHKQFSSLVDHYSSSGRFSSSTCANYQEIPKNRSSTDSIYKRWLDYNPELDPHAKLRSDNPHFNCKSSPSDWNKFREESKRHVLFAEEEIARNKEAMMNNLHLLTLEATAKEMLEAIKEIRDDTKEIRNGQ